MFPLINDHARGLISQTLPLLESRRQQIVESVRESLESARPGHRLPGRPGAIAATLVDLLLARARHFLKGGALGDLSEVLPGHAAQGIDGRHYSRFGDAIVPVLRDVLGPTAPRATASAWCDLFWIVIRAAKARYEPAPA